jgi:serine/threonine protein kinase
MVPSASAQDVVTDPDHIDVTHEADGDSAALPGDAVSTVSLRGDADTSETRPPGPDTAKVPLEELFPRGTSLGRYVILDPLGQGGMGAVYAAYDPDLDRRVAIKLLHPGSRSESGDVRLRREAQAMARLSHPNVVNIFDVLVVGSHVVLAMELVPGTTLATWLEARPRAPQEILAALLQAGRGLQAAHDAGLVHRDFKPSNVLIDGEGRVRVTDFGVARASSDHTPEPTLDDTTPSTRRSPAPAPRSARRGTWRPSSAAARATPSRISSRSASRCSRRCTGGIRTR